MVKNPEFRTPTLRSALILVLLCLFVALACFTATAAEPPKPFPNKRIIRVHSGDSFDIKLWGKTRRVRLYGIDAPEEGLALSQEAREYLETLLRDPNLRFDTPFDSQAPDLDTVPPLVKKLDTIVIPRIKLKNVSLKKTAEIIVELSKKHDPEHKGIRILWAAPPTEKLEPPVFRKKTLPNEKDDNPEEDGASAKKVAITLDFENVTLGGLLRHVALGAGLWMRIERQGVVLYNDTPPYLNVPAVHTLSAYSPAKGYSVSYLMLRKGYARLFPIYEYEPVSRELKHAEDLARKEKLGVWGLKDKGMSPWRYRLYKTNGEADETLKPEALWP